jgi:hypothetical protein
LELTGGGISSASTSITSLNRIIAQIVAIREASLSAWGDIVIHLRKKLFVPLMSVVCAITARLYEQGQGLIEELTHLREALTLTLPEASSSSSSSSRAAAAAAVTVAAPHPRVGVGGSSYEDRGGGGGGVVAVTSAGTTGVVVGLPGTTAVLQGKGEGMGGIVSGLGLGMGRWLDNRACKVETGEWSRRGEDEGAREVQSSAVQKTKRARSKSREREGKRKGVAVQGGSIPPLVAALKDKGKGKGGYGEERSGMTKKQEKQKMLAGDGDDDDEIDRLFRELI